MTVFEIKTTVLKWKYFVLQSLMNFENYWGLFRFWKEKWNNDAASVKVGTRRKWIRGQMDFGLKFQKISKINSSIIITGDTGATIMTSWSIFRIWSDHLPKRSSPPILIIFTNFTHWNFSQKTPYFHVFGEIIENARRIYFELRFVIFVKKTVIFESKQAIFVKKMSQKTN